MTSPLIASAMASLAVLASTVAELATSELVMVAGVRRQYVDVPRCGHIARLERREVQVVRAFFQSRFSEWCEHEVAFTKKSRNHRTDYSLESLPVNPILGVVARILANSRKVTVPARSPHANRDSQACESRSDVSRILRPSRTYAKVSHPDAKVSHPDAKRSPNGAKGPVLAASLESFALDINHVGSARYRKPASRSRRNFDRKVAFGVEKTEITPEKPVFERPQL